MNRDRLLRLAAILEKDSADESGMRFDINNWGYSQDPLLPVNCGTTWCAVGLAMLSGIFTGEGLGYVRDEGAEAVAIIPAFDGSRGWAAVVRFFGVDSRQASRLFSYDQYPVEERMGAVGELAVAKRIREFCA